MSPNGKLEIFSQKLKFGHITHNLKKYRGGSEKRPSNLLHIKLPSIEIQPASFQEAGHLIQQGHFYSGFIEKIK